MPYPQSFKEAMIQRMTGPTRVSATVLAQEVGVPQTSLSRWLREASTLRPMTKKKKRKRGKSKEEKSPRDWTFEEKLRVVAAAADLSDEELGEFLRREGLHEAQLNEWRAAMQSAVMNSRPKKRASGEKKQIRELERELRRKEKALAEVTALLVLKKKWDAYLEEKEKGTQKKNDD